MNRMSLVVVAVGVVTAVTVFAPTTTATILIFNLDPWPGNGGGFSQAYGDRINALSDAVGTYGVGSEGFTPNVLTNHTSPCCSVRCTSAACTQGGVARPHPSPASCGGISSLPQTRSK